MRHPDVKGIVPRKILVVKPSSLGDIVHSLPVLNALSRCHPQATIDWVIARGFESLLENHPMIHRLWIIKKDSWKKIRNAKQTVREITILLRELKREKYDLVVDLQGLLRSGVIAAATGSPFRIGFQEAREGSGVFYTHAVHGGRNIHAVDRYLKIVTHLGCDASDVRFPLPSLEGNPPRTSYFASPDALQRYVVLVPGARWKTKRWPAQRFGKLAASLPIKSIVVGSKSDVDIANEIVSLSNGQAVSFAGKTDLKDVIGIMRGAQFVVSNDSGPMHIAAAIGTPVFAIFGPTAAQQTGPYGEGHSVIRSDIPCAPCFKRSCDDMRCMAHVSVDEVLAVILSKTRAL